MTPELRVLTPKEYDKIIDVWQRSGLSFRPSGRDSRKEIERQMSLDPEMFLGCFAGKELVGVVIGSYDSRKGWLNRLAVVPEHRREGIAKLLVQEMEKILAEKGFKIIAVLIEDESKESMQFFSGAGYVKHGDIHYYTKRESKDI